jgi:fatty acid amide hydrolase 2
MIDTDDRALLTQSATMLAAGIAAGALRSETVVDAHIRRIELINPSLNALVGERFEAARSEARAVDRSVAAAEPGTSFPPFYGVPFSVKECIGVAGQPNTGALWSHAGVVADEDAVVVARLRAAGAINVGVSNLSEGGFWIEAVNRIYGRTGNAYDPMRTSGGSSGGEGALVGSGATPFGMGSDIGGSIRIPACLNGVFGHKASGGLVPLTGHRPQPENEARNYLCLGPLARRAEDLWPLLETIAGADEHDPDCTLALHGDPQQVDLRHLRLISWKGNGAQWVGREVAGAHRSATDRLLASGMTLDLSPRPKAMKKSLDMWSQCMREAAADQPLRKILAGGQPFNPWKELLLWLFGRSKHTIPPLVVSIAEDFPLFMPRDRQPMVRAMLELRAHLNDLLADDGVLLLPTYAVVAPRHAASLLRPFLWSLPGLFNLLGLPATQVPCGLSKAGLPMGVQVIAARGNDHLTIAVALELERLMGGWRSPFGELSADS